jgi:hypothetical protein
MTTEKEERYDILLAKLMCERKGKKENIPLGVQYWNRPEWKLFFKNQILAANTLLKLYPFEVVHSAITSKKAAWMYSLRSPQLKQILIDEFAKYERKEKIEEIRKEKESKKEVIIQNEIAPVILDNSKSLKSRLD